MTTGQPESLASRPNNFKRIFMMTRRQAIKTTALVTAACATVLPAANAQQPAPVVAPTLIAGPFTLPPLPYSFDALDPPIDALTMEIHPDKHHQPSVTN